MLGIETVCPPKILTSHRCHQTSLLNARATGLKTATELQDHRTTATGPNGHRATEPQSHRATEPQGHIATGPQTQPHSHRASQRQSQRAMATEPVHSIKKDKIDNRSSNFNLKIVKATIRSLGRKTKIVKCGVW